MNSIEQYLKLVTVTSAKSPVASVRLSTLTAVNGYGYKLRIAPVIVDPTSDISVSPILLFYEESHFYYNDQLRKLSYDNLFNANYGKGTSNELLMVEYGWRSFF